MESAPPGSLTTDWTLKASAEEMSAAKKRLLWDEALRVSPDECPIVTARPAGQGLSRTP